jgi:drug/metabolite transporter (DMT)-like permease
MATPVLRTETAAGLLKTRELTIAVVVSQVIGNVALSRGLHPMGSLLSLSPWPYLRALANPWVAGGVLILAFWMLSNLTLLSRADLSYVLPVTSVSYVLIAVLGRFLLHERIHLLRWVGIVVITAGVMIVGRTPTRTTPDVLEKADE